jgi:hypothetical protein
MAKLLQNRADAHQSSSKQDDPPVVVLLVYDLAGNTLDQPTTNFDVIQPGEFQTKEALISANCPRIAKIHVYRAYDPDLECPGDYYPLTGVHEVTYNFTR